MGEGHPRSTFDRGGILLVALFLAPTAVGCGEVFPPRTPSFQPNQATFDAPRPLAPEIPARVTAKILENENTVYAAWMTPLATPSNLSTVFVSTSGDHGRTWAGQRLNLPDYQHYGVDGMDWPFVLAPAPEGNLHLVTSAYEGILFTVLDPSGRVLASTKVGDAPWRFTYYRNPSLCTSRGALLIFYTRTQSEQAAGPCAVYLQRSFDGGATWSASEKIKGTESMGYSTCRPLAASQPSGEAFLFCQPKLYKSDDQGRTWKGVAGRLGASALGQNLFKIDRDGTLYLAWLREKVTKEAGSPFANLKQEGYTQVCLRKSKNGRTWTRPVHANDVHLPFEWKMAPPGLTFPEYYREYALQVTRKAVLLDLAASPSGNSLGLLWKDWRSGAERLYFSCSLDGGQTWCQNAPIAPDLHKIPTDASLAIADDQTIHVLWLASDTPLRQYDRQAYGSTGHLGT